MASFTSYEVQTYSGGAWKIESIYDDREIAIFESKRVLRRGHYLAVRVVEECSQPGKSEAVVKTIFRLNKTELGEGMARTRQAAAGAARSATYDFPAAARSEFAPRPRPGAAAAQSAAQSIAGPVFMVLLLATILLAGIGAILALRHYFGVL